MFYVPKTSEIKVKTFVSSNLAVAFYFGVCVSNPRFSTPGLSRVRLPGPLGVGELLVLHTLLEPGGLLPEQPLPRGEVRPLEERVLQNPLHPCDEALGVAAGVVSDAIHNRGRPVKSKVY